MTPIRTLIESVREKFPLANQVALDEKDFAEYMKAPYDDEFDVLPLNSYYKDKGVGSVIIQHNDGTEMYDLRTLMRVEE